MDPRDAMDQIAEIRRQMAEGELYRGYRSWTVGSVGLMGLAAAVAQPQLVPSPATDLGGYLTLWIAVATAAALLVAADMWSRVRTTRSDAERAATLLSADRFLPCVAVGALVTLAIYSGAREAGWMLPGLWSLIFSLGVFASYRQLPRQVFWIGIYFAACGFVALLWGRDANAFSPWLMGSSFGGGLLMGAVILRLTLERTGDIEA